MSEVPTSSGNSQSYRYWAFISYNSRDLKEARWLHRAIETYEIPTQLAGKSTPFGEPAPKRFHPVFKDREEMPAGPDISVHVLRTLRESRYLIVLCSPSAAASTWVNKEVETIISLGRRDRVLAFIVDGTPPDCFPLALRRGEPIAADARAEADGKEDAKLKLLAGMLGVSFDALKQRDAHRKIRRLQLMLGAALMMIMGFGGLAWYANQQRIKAVKARQQAEGILEYMLYDLRDKLVPLGRLDIVDDVQKRVDLYYRQLGTEDILAGTGPLGLALLNCVLK